MIGKQGPFMKRCECDLGHEACARFECGEGWICRIDMSGKVYFTSNVCVKTR